MAPVRIIGHLSGFASNSLLYVDEETVDGRFLGFPEIELEA